MLSATYILKINVHGVLYSTLPRIEPNFKRYYIGLMMIIFAFKKGELKKKLKTLILAYQLRIRLGFQNWPKFGRIPDPGYGLPTLITTSISSEAQKNVDGNKYK